MLMQQFSKHECPVAQALAEIGDGWTLLIIREAMYGTSQFESFRKNINISRGTLANRLAQLTAAHILQKTTSDKDTKNDGRETRYTLTAKGRDLWPVMLSLLMWSEQHISGRHIVAAHSRTTGIKATHICAVDETGNIISPQDTILVPGKHISPSFKTRLEDRFKEQKEI